MSTIENEKIDFVITWVDMNDEKWRLDFNKYSNPHEDSNSTNAARFRDYGLLKYWFRGVEQFAPWVNTIHFVTCGQKPDWLDENNPKLKLVNHTDFIPKEYLPTFNSNVIESYMHKIPNLSEKFVYFNDDLYLVDTVPVTRFFKNGLPCDIAGFRTNSGSSQYGKNLKNNVRLLNKHFNKMQVLRRDKAKWLFADYGSRTRLTKLLQFYPKFVTFRTPHNAQPYLKSTFLDVWQHCEAELKKVSQNRFRTDEDLTPELFRSWQICRSDFTPYNTYSDSKMFPLFIKSKEAIEALNNRTYKLVCLNDNINIRNYAEVMQQIAEALDKILPTKSSFEKF